MTSALSWVAAHSVSGAARQEIDATDPVKQFAVAAG